MFPILGYWNVSYGGYLGPVLGVSTMANDPTTSSSTNITLITPTLPIAS
jgi:hypothetical protein